MRNINFTIKEYNNKNRSEVKYEFRYLFYLVARFKNNNRIKENDKIYESKNTAIESKLSIYSGLNENERLLIYYIINNEYINNKISREQLGLTKSASINAFNNLIKKGIIEKIGASSSTKYILKTNKL